MWSDVIDLHEFYRSRLGQVARRHVSEAAFRHCFLVGLFVLGSYLAWRAAAAMV